MVGPNNIVKLVPVTPGAQVGSNIVIASGLKGGEQVVTEGLDKIRDGSPVSPQPEQAQDTSAPAQSKPNAATTGASNNAVAGAGAAGKAR